jgi:hypothetical protein
MTEPQQAYAQYAISTWRYLRLAMVGIVLALATAVVIEVIKAHGHCVKTSISAYYYSPVRALFVAALVGIGICMICLRGSSQLEDVLLNLAGMFAPIVALVPTPKAGGCPVVAHPAAGVGAAVANNVAAFLVAGGGALLVAGALAAGRDGGWMPLIGWLAGVALWSIALLVFLLARRPFVHDAHYAAALSMFLCLIAVTVDNARGCRGHRGLRAARNPYVLIAAAMVAAAVAAVVAAALGWQYWVIATEIALISLFAAFWITQTVDLWRPGLRPTQPG